MRALSFAASTPCACCDVTHLSSCSRQGACLIVVAACLCSTSFSFLGNLPPFSYQARSIACPCISPPRSRLSWQKISASWGGAELELQLLGALEFALEGIERESANGDGSPRAAAASQGACCSAAREDRDPRRRVQSRGCFTRARLRILCFLLIKSSFTENRKSHCASSAGFGMPPRGQFWMLRKYATTSAWLCVIAKSSAVPLRSRQQLQIQKTGNLHLF